MLSDVEIGSLLGRGAYGYVYRARWLSTDVAIKVALTMLSPWPCCMSIGSSEVWL